MKKALLYFVLVIVCILIAGTVFISVYVTGDRLASHANEALGDELEVSIGSAFFNLFTQTLTLNDVVIRVIDDRFEDNRNPDDPTGNADNESDEGAETDVTAEVAEGSEGVEEDTVAENGTFTNRGFPGSELFTAGRIVIGDINIREAFNDSISIGYLRVESFTFDQTILPELNADENGGDPFAGLLIESVSFQNGTVKYAAASDGNGIINGLNMNAGPLTLDPECEDCSIPVQLSNIELVIASVEMQFNRDRYELQVNSIRISEEYAFVQIASIRLEPTLSDPQFFQSLEYGTDVYDVSVAGLNIDQLNFQELREGGDFRAMLISVDSLDLHIKADVSLPKDPDATHPPMPIQAFNDLPVQVAIDSVIIHHGDIRYSEYVDSSKEPGTILFARTYAKLENVYTGSEDPVVLTATTFLEGSGEINTEFKLSKEESGSLTRISGKLRDFQIEELNSILVNLAGVRVESGTVHELEFSFYMTDRRSSGFMWINYEDFSIRLVDKEDESRTTLQRVTGFLVDQIAVRGSSKNGNDNTREGQIAEDKDPEKPFFNYLWTTLRSGLMDVLIRF